MLAQAGLASSTSSGRALLGLQGEAHHLEGVFLWAGCRRLIDSVPVAFPVRIRRSVETVGNVRPAQPLRSYRDHPRCEAARDSDVDRLASFDAPDDL